MLPATAIPWPTKLTQFSPAARRNSIARILIGAHSNMAAMQGYNATLVAEHRERQADYVELGSAKV